MSKAKQRVINNMTGFEEIKQNANFIRDSLSFLAFGADGVVRPLYNLGMDCDSLYSNDFLRCVFIMSSKNKGEWSLWEPTIDIKCLYINEELADWYFVHDQKSLFVSKRNPLD